MNEILIQTLIDKMSLFEKREQEVQEMIKALPDYTPALQQANQRIDAIQAEISKIPGQISMPEKLLFDLKSELATHRGQLREPLPQKVLHHHHLSNPLWACLGLGCIVMIMTYFLTLTSNQAKQHKDADIKYRYLKLSSPGLEKELNYFDSLYAANPDQMQKTVESEEQSRQQLFEASQRAEDANKNLQQLKEKGNKIGSPNGKIR